MVTVVMIFKICANKDNKVLVKENALKDLTDQNLVNVMLDAIIFKIAVRTSKLFVQEMIPVIKS